ncbi:lantibiotic dehydratase [Mucilaginibacter lutimaris]|uniref:Lantibiotic dehydratase n=1 Tax=Mucilaginibacter lutimaris TaxID=931629 RepID=A0ABW2ZAS4_9SPHI
MPPSLQLYPLLVCRAAARPLLSHHTETLLSDAYFRTAIWLASPDFYAVLEKHTFDFNKLDSRSKRSLSNYVNRICNRATPFGAFAGFAALRFGDSNQKIRIGLTDSLLFLSPDFRELIAADKRHSETAMPNIIKTNTTVYYPAHDIRFIAFDQETAEKRRFRIDCIRKDPLTMRILSYCKSEKNHAEIMDYLHNYLGNDEADALIRELLKLQLLTGTASPPLTLTEAAVQTSFSKAISVSSEEMNQIPLHHKGHYYANLRLSVKGMMPPSVKEKLTQAIHNLSFLASGSEPETLTRFKKDFKERFGGQAVPLMAALDPATGVSYGGLGQAINDSPLLQDLMQDVNVSVRETILEWRPIHQLLLKKWPEGRSSEINLTSSELEALGKPSLPWPAGFSVPFRISGNRLLLGQAGGVSATALIARFAPFDPELRDAVNNIAESESKNNPGVHFAEIICITDGKTDNINQRSVILKKEIPVSGASSVPETDQLLPSELYLSMHGDELILWSPRFSERIVPRLSSAYNFQRAELPLFRFLCDLPYQSVLYNWTLDPAQLFPGLSYYPRISVGDSILSLAKWQISEQELSTVKKAPFKYQLAAFRELAAAIGLPARVALTRHDQFLVFDILQDQSLRSLLNEALPEKTIGLTEVFEENTLSGTVVNAEGKTHASEFVASVTSTAPAYNGNTPKPPNPYRRKVKISCHPGREWLYYKLYMPEFNTNPVLSVIGQLIEKLVKSGIVKEWFFVRYYDLKPHIRLRIKPTNIISGEVMHRCQSLFERFLRQGKIHMISVHTYEPETARYKYAGMETAEQLFCLSSRMILAVVRKGATPAYYTGIKICYDTIRLFFPSPAERLGHIKQVHDSLRAEIDPDGLMKSNLEKTKRRMNKDTRELLDNDRFYIENNISKLARNYLRILKSVRSAYAVTDDSFVADINHMHINRSLLRDMRKQEMVIYHLLYQYEISQIKRQL